MQGQPVVAVCQVCSCYLLNSPQAIVQAPSMHTERLLRSLYVTGIVQKALQRREKSLTFRVLMAEQGLQT